MTIKYYFYKIEIIEEFATRLAAMARISKIEDNPLISEIKIVYSEGNELLIQA